MLSRAHNSLLPFAAFLLGVSLLCQASQPALAQQPAADVPNPFGLTASERIQALTEADLQHLTDVVADPKLSYKERSDAYDALAEFIPAPRLVPFFKSILDRVQDDFAGAALTGLLLSDEDAAAQTTLQKYSGWPRDLQRQGQSMAEQRLRSWSRVQSWRGVLRLVLLSPPEDPAPTPATSSGTGPVPQPPENAMGGSLPKSATTASPEDDAPIATAASALAEGASLEERQLIVSALGRFPHEPLLWIAAVQAGCPLSSAQQQQAEQLWHDKAQPLALRLTTAAILSPRRTDAVVFVATEINDVLARYGSIDMLVRFSQAWNASPGTSSSDRKQMRELLRLTAVLPRLLRPLLVMEEGAALRLTLRAWKTRNVYVRLAALSITTERFPQQILVMKPNSDPLLDPETLNTQRILVALKHPELRSQIEKIMGKQFQPALERVRRGGS